MEKPRIFLISKDGDILDFFNNVLSTKYSVVNTFSTEDLLSNIKDSAPTYDIVIFDTSLNPSGELDFKFIKDVRDAIKTPPEFIVLSPQGEEAAIDKLLERGFCYYVEKGTKQTNKLLELSIQKALHCRQIYKEKCNNISLLSNMSNALVTAAEGKDPFRYRHSHRITKWAVLVGKRMGLSHQELADLEIGARLRNIGLAMIPDIIITKPGKRTVEEKRFFEQHPKLGYDIIKDVPAMSKDALNVILHHHERYDGQGYPYGLSGDAIPLFAMITRTAIDFEHAFSPAENRAIRDPERAKKTIINLAKEGALNPEIVKVYLDVYEDGELTKIDPLSHSDELFFLAIEAAKVHNFVEVRKHCENALAEINRESKFFGSFFCVAIGDLFFEYKQYKDASDYYKMAVKLRPGHAEAFYKRGLAFEKQEMWERADWHYSVAISMVPTYMEAHLSKGNVLYKGMFMDEAMRSFDRVIALEQNSPAAYLGRGRIFNEKINKLYERGNFTKANEHTITAKGNYEKARGILANKPVLTDSEQLLLDEIQQALEALD